MTKKTEKENLKDISGFHIRDEPLTIFKGGNSKVVTIPAKFSFEIADTSDVSYEEESVNFVKKGKDAVTENDTWRNELRDLQKNMQEILEICRLMNLKSF